MIEILALIFLTRKIGDKATLKGLPVGRWKLYTILAWFGGEILGVVLGLMVSDNLLSAVGIGVLCAVGGYLVVKYNIDKQPDKSSMNDWMDHIGEQDSAA
jgi:hypothetical protein